MDYSTAAWAIGAIAWVAILVYLFWMVGPVWKDKLVMCPETGGVTLVGVRHVAHAGKAPGIEVERCALWPNQQGCARGCLARYRETPRGLGINTDGADRR